MKKSLLSVFAVAAGLLMATSCSNELEEVKTEGEAVVTFTAELPRSMVNRAPQKATDATTFGDGTTATNLSYAVYRVTEDTEGATTYDLIADLSGEKTINISTTVSLKLVNGNRYAVAFWADATTADKASIYTFDKPNYTITADYTGVATSDESLDAFYAVKEITVSGSSQEVVELRRPFAQLNIGTGDLEASKAAGQEVLKAGVKVIVPNTLNLKSGEVSGENTVEFALADLPEVTFPVTGYNYLTMNYLLMSTDKKADNTVTISYDNANVPERVFNNVPLQRNYRTNIYGNLLTSTTDFNVIIKPEFEDPDNDVEIWDGATTKEPEVENNAYIVKTPSEWAYLCGIQVTKSIELAADLDFGGNELGSINLQGNNLHVDGNDFTIKNVKLVGDNKCIAGLGTYHASLFCSPNNQQGKDTVRNLTVRGAEVICLNEDCQPGNIKGHAAVIFATLEPNAHDITIENVHVIGADVYGIQPVAGIVGRNGSVPVKIDGCSVEDSYLHNESMTNESGFVASIIGRTDNAANVTIVNTVSKNNKIEGYYASRRGEASIQEIAASGIDVEGVTASDNTVIKKPVADAVVSTTEELTAALAAGKSVIELKAGNYTINNSTGLTGDKTISIVGADKETTILTLAEATYQEGAKLSFSNVTISSVATGSYDLFFYRGAELNFTNCDINGVLRTTATKTIVDNCIIDNPNAKSDMMGYPVWFYAGSMEFKNSTIKGNTKGILVYSESAVEFNLTIDNCQFINKTDADDKAAIEIHTEKGIYGTLIINNTTISGFPTSVGAGAGLWNEVVNVDIRDNPYGTMGTQTKRFKVTVDGNVKQEQVL